MTEKHCCDSTKGAFKKAICPVNGRSYSRVALKTILHHVTKPWQRNLVEQGYYFCDDPECNVVYFGEDQSLLTLDDMRIVVGIKSKNNNKPVCYCFDVTQHDFETQPQVCREYIIEKTRLGSCDCEIRNPAGRCCLRDIPKFNTKGEL